MKQVFGVLLLSVSSLLFASEKEDNLGLKWLEKEVLSNGVSKDKIPESVLRKEWDLRKKVLQLALESGVQNKADVIYDLEQAKNSKLIEIWQKEKTESFEKNVSKKELDAVYKAKFPIKTKWLVHCLFDDSEGAARQSEKWKKMRWEDAYKDFNQKKELNKKSANGLDGWIDKDVLPKEWSTQLAGKNKTTELLQIDDKQTAVCLVEQEKSDREIGFEAVEKQLRKELASIEFNKWLMQATKK